MLVRIIKNWNYPDLFCQTPNNSGIWEGITFTLEPVKECDYVIVLNYIPKDMEVYCPKENVWAIMQEPYISGISDWMVEGHKQFAKVFTHYIFSKSPKYISSQPVLPWHINRSYKELISMQLPKKDKEISWVTSNKTHFSGHKLRMSFLKLLQDYKNIKIDIYGKGIKYIEDKWDATAPYYYSLAIENSRSKDYWTEKISDCFLSYTLPIYYGCINIAEYFPEKSFIRIDITKPEEALKIIEKAINGKEWEKRLDAIVEARDKVLNEYQFFPFIYKKIEQDNKQLKPVKFILNAYKQSIKRKIVNKIKSVIGFLSTSQL